MHAAVVGAVDLSHEAVHQAAWRALGDDRAPGDAAAAPTGPETSALIVTQEHLMLEGALDALEVSVGAWIYVEGPTVGASVKTIVSNRNAGCNVDANHRGYTFHVNNWETSDRALVLEYRTASGCGRISSDPETVPVDTWVHVGFAFQGPKAGSGSGEGKVMLFLNGKLLRQLFERDGRKPAEFTWYVSPLDRTMETMQRVRSAFDVALPVAVPDRRLVEVSFGVYEGRLHSELSAGEMAEVLDKFKGYGQQ